MKVKVKIKFEIGDRVMFLPSKSVGYEVTFVADGIRNYRVRSVYNFSNYFWVNESEITRDIEFYRNKKINELLYE